MLVNKMENYYELLGTSSSNMGLQWPHSTTVDNNSISSIMAGGGGGATIIPPFMMCSKEAATLSPEARALAACQSHKEAERQRRHRINSQIATLRTLLPNLFKTDKASVLGEVVRRLHELKKATLELIADDRDNADGCKTGLLPGEMDEVKLCRSESDNTMIIASLCCEDRTELIVDLTRALKSVKGKIVRAEMATVGGRTRCVLWVRGVLSGGGSGGGPEGLLKRALKVVVDKPSVSTRMGHGLVGSRIHRPY